LSAILSLAPARAGPGRGSRLTAASQRAPKARGPTEPNLVWNEPVLIRTGATVDILLDVTNPGLWMAHCHIAEHHESGMMRFMELIHAEDERIPVDALEFGTRMIERMDRAPQ
jgi:hypothetical protein